MITGGHQAGPAKNVDRGWKNISTPSDTGRRLTPSLRNGGNAVGGLDMQLDYHQRASNSRSITYYLSRADFVASARGFRTQGRVGGTAGRWLVVWGGLPVLGLD